MYGDNVILPGESVEVESGFLRGHGTVVSDSKDTLVSAVSGAVRRVNKLVSVEPHKRRYVGEVGDLVVGRITSVGAKSWKVEVRASLNAVLMLSSVHLPGNVQRIRTYEDQLQMRSMYAEDDLISAEVQSVNSDGVLALHTRSLRYGKLSNGCLVTVPSSLVRRLRQHFVQLPMGVTMLLGVNGFIWLSAGDDVGTSAHVDADMAEELQSRREAHAETAIPVADRRRIARVRNAIRALAAGFRLITPEAVVAVYERSAAEAVPVAAMATPEFSKRAVAWAAEALESRRRR